MSFLETPIFPARVSIDYESRPKFSNVRTVVASGFDDVLIRHEQPLRTLVMTHPVLDATRHAELNHWFNAVKGMGHRFRAQDWSDYKVNVTEGVLAPMHGSLLVGTAGVGFGTPKALFQKKYTAGSLTTFRNIQKPKLVPAIQIYRGLVLQTLTTNYSIDTTTGYVTFVHDQTRTISSHTPGADHVLGLASALSPNITPGQRIYVTGVSGTAASVLNNLSHLVTGVSVANVTIETNTTGLTASIGSVFTYPQASETLNWVGQFDVPVRFDSDEANFAVLGRNPATLLYEWSGINLIETRLPLT